MGWMPDDYILWNDCVTHSINLINLDYSLNFLSNSQVCVNVQAHTDPWGLNFMNDF